MTTYFAGIGGSDASNGTTWALRKLTLAGVEALSLAGDDVVYVGPGTYRETLTTSHSGTSGHPITYIADEGGTLTDGIGGGVRITGSDNDQTATRASGIVCANSWRTFRGFHGDTFTTQFVSNSGGNNIVEECAGVGCGTQAILNTGASAVNNTYRKNFFIVSLNRGIEIVHSATVDNSGVVMENNTIIGGGGAVGIRISRFGGLSMRNNLLLGLSVGINCIVAPSAAQVNNVNNNDIIGCAVGLNATATTDLTEDYNNLFANNTARTNVSVGAHSPAYSPLLALPLLSIGVHVPILGMLDPASALGSIVGINVPTDDMYSLPRLATSSWGPVQYQSAAQILSSALMRMMGEA